MNDARARLLAVGFNPAELADKSPARCEYLLACARKLLVDRLVARFAQDAVLGFVFARSRIFASRSRHRRGGLAARKERSS